MDERTLHALEFPRVLERLSEFCKSEAGKAAALSLRPMSDEESVRTSQHLYDEMRSWLAEGEFSPVSFPDISGLLSLI
ncbi:MAG: endonuclease MutS2, partial [Mailhella sp.]